MTASGVDPGSRPAGPTATPRVAVVGARRTRSGLGPFVARELARAGAEVPAFVVSRPESLAAARRGLEAQGVSGARGFLSLPALLEEVPVDAVAVLSPAETHEAQLETALAAGCHVLCEKPLVWGGPEPAAAAARIVAAFQERGLVLQENCQWPFTLATFDALHPGVRTVPPARFAMRLSPSGRGAGMLPDALPHVLSLLQALTGPGPTRIGDVVFAAPEPGADAGALVTFRFAFHAPAARIEATVALHAGGRPPRTAWYEIDGRRARREVGADYALFLVDGERRVALPDPLRPLVSAFVGAVARARSGVRPPLATALAERLAHVAAIYDAHRARFPEAAGALR